MRRFPLGLSLAAGVAFLILLGLGVWQLQRLAWKQNLLARVAALRSAQPQPLNQVLALASRGDDVEYRRVAAACLPSVAPAAYRYALHDGQIGWRLLSVCRLANGRFDSVLLDRGLVEQFAGAMAPGTATFAPPTQIVGVLRAPGSRPMLGPAQSSPGSGPSVFRVLDDEALRQLTVLGGGVRPAPLLLAVETETPPLAGVTPAALPQDIPNNHLVYALTWFALAAVMVSFYGAMLFRRRTGQ